MNEALKDFEKKMAVNFTRRQLDNLVGKSPDEIIQKYVDWRHSRYTVIEDIAAFHVVDMKEKECPIAVVFKKDPDAFNHAWQIAEDMNELPESYCSIGGEMFEISDFECEPEYKPSDITIGDVIRGLDGCEIFSQMMNGIDKENEE